MEDSFGRMVVHVEEGIAYLTLYETPNLVCDGFLLEERVYKSDPREHGNLDRREQRLELVVEEEVLTHLDRQIRSAMAYDKEAFAFGEIMEYGTFYLGFQVQRPLWQTRRDLWAGWVYSRQPRERFGFVLEQFRSPDPYVVLAAVWVAFFLGTPLLQTLLTDCAKRAKQTCGGSNNVKFVKDRRVVSMTALLAGKVDDGCEFECGRSSDAPAPT